MHYNAVKLLKKRNVNNWANILTDKYFFVWTYIELSKEFSEKFPIASTSFLDSF